MAKPAPAASPVLGAGALLLLLLSVAGGVLLGLGLGVAAHAMGVALPWMDEGALLLGVLLPWLLAGQTARPLLLRPQGGGAFLRLGGVLAVLIQGAGLVGLNAVLGLTPVQVGTQAGVLGDRWFQGTTLWERLGAPLKREVYAATHDVDSPVDGSLVDAANAPEGSVFRWEDAQGGLHISSSPPEPGGRLLAVAVPSKRVPPEPVTRPQAQPSDHSTAARQKLPSLSGTTPLGTGVELASTAAGRATWVMYALRNCGACKEQGPVLAQFQAAHAATMDLVVAVDAHSMDDTRAADWAREHGLQPSQVWRVPGEQMPEGAYPQHVVLAAGDAQVRYHGFMDAKGLASLLNTALHMKQ